MPMALHGENTLDSLAPSQNATCPQRCLSIAQSIPLDAPMSTPSVFYLPL